MFRERSRIYFTWKKMKQITFNKIACKDYLKDPRISQTEAKLLFKLRTYMYPVKTNFKNHAKQNKTDLNCELCKSELDTQQQLFKCNVLKRIVPELSTTKVKYQDIFRNVDKMVSAGKLLVKIVVPERNYWRLWQIVNSLHIDINFHQLMAQCTIFVCAQKLCFCLDVNIYNQEY